MIDTIRPQPVPPEPLAVRPREAARMLGVSARTVWQWTREGRIRCVRVGEGKRTAVLYPVAELKKLLGQCSEA